MAAWRHGVGHRRLFLLARPRGRDAGHGLDRASRQSLLATLRQRLPLAPGAQAGHPEMRARADTCRRSWTSGSSDVLRCLGVVRSRASRALRVRRSRRVLRLLLVVRSLRVLGFAARPALGSRPALAVRPANAARPALLLVLRSPRVLRPLLATASFWPCSPCASILFLRSVSGLRARARRGHFAHCAHGRSRSPSPAFCACCASCPLYARSRGPVGTPYAIHPLRGATSPSARLDPRGASARCPGAGIELRMVSPFS